MEEEVWRRRCGGGGVEEGTVCRIKVHVNKDATYAPPDSVLTVKTMS